VKETTAGDADAPALQSATQRDATHRVVLVHPLIRFDITTSVDDDCAPKANGVPLSQSLA